MRNHASGAVPSFTPVQYRARLLRGRPMSPPPAQARGANLVCSDSENDLQPELHLPRVERRRDLAERRGVGSRPGVIEVRMVERVEQLRAELNLEPFGHVEITAQGEVKVLEARPDDDVAARGSERTDRLRLKRGFIEPLFNGLGP